MKTITFTDLDGQELRVQMSSLATEEAFRIYLSGEDIVEKDDGIGNKIPVAIHLNRNQAEILVNALRDLFDKNV